MITPNRNKKRPANNLQYNKVMSIHLSFSYDQANIATDKINASLPQIEKAYTELQQKIGKGSDFLGWLDLPGNIFEEELCRIENRANHLASISEVVVVIGIGGSYLGTRAVVEILAPYFENPSQKSNYPQLLYAGNHLSEEYLNELLTLLDRKEYSLVVISKSGTTTEPAIAFRVLREHCEKKYGARKSVERIVAITDAKRGALKELSSQKGYDTFVISDDVGGRYSVLSPVGLLPIAIAGFSIRQLLDGAQNMRRHVYENGNFSDNIAVQYASIRNILYADHKKIELMVAYEPRFYYFIEWFKQLFGESEGKEHKGIFPAGAIFSTDLHSLGQYIQEGERVMFETVLSVLKSKKEVEIPYDQEDLDALNYLHHRSLQEINQIAEQGTRMAHVAGGVPNLRITIPEISPEIVGELIYFFEFSCALSAYMLGVNPFNQPGVEAYKKNMFALLGKTE